MPPATTKSLGQRLSQRHIDPLYLLCGEEQYLIQAYTSLLTERILDNAARDFNYNVFYAASSSIEEVVSVASTLPLMASHRVVVLHGLEQLKKPDWQQLVAYLRHPSPSTALICSGHEHEERKYPAEVWAQAQVILCQPLEGLALRQWVSKIVQQRGCQINPDALQAFLQEQDTNLWTLEQEIDKLCTYVGDKKKITLQDVQEVGYGLRHHSIFALSEALGARQVAVALREIDHLLHQGEPPLVILSMMTRHIRLLWSLKQLVQRSYDLPRIARMLGVPQPVCRRLIAQHQGFSTGHLQRLYSAVLEADLLCKSSNKPPKAVLEELVFTLCVEAYS